MPSALSHSPAEIDKASSPIGDALDPLIEELDLWAAQGDIATLWWRDDDATRPGPALDRMLAIAAAYQAPVALAVIPAAATADLAARLARETMATAMQHGWAHTNHAPPGEKKAEFGAHRPVSDMVDDVNRGRIRMNDLFGEGGWLPIFVPPHNRVTPKLLEALADLKFKGVSTSTPRPARPADPGLIQSNVHADPIDWRNDRAIKSASTIADELAHHLRDRRTGAVDPTEPTGFMTHHAVCNDIAWAVIEQVVAVVGNHTAARWLPAASVFEESA